MTLVMDVASATSTASRPFPLATARGGDTAVAEAGIPTPAASTDSEPLVNRFPSIAFSYDVDASRLVMLYRDPANGKTVSQIPTETALKQYKEAQQQERRAAALTVTVGGPDDTGGDAGKAKGGAAAAPPVRQGTVAPAHASSGSAASVAYFQTSTTHPAAATSGVARVNVVI